MIKITTLLKHKLLVLFGIILIGFLLFYTTSMSHKQSVQVTENRQPIKISTIEEIQPRSLSGVHVLPNSSLVGVSRKTGTVVVYTKDGEEKELYSKPISNYSVTSPYVAIIEQRDFSKIVIANTETFVERTIDASKYNQVIAATISPDYQFLYFVGDYSPISNSANLYKTELNNFNPEILSPIAALKIEALSDNKLLIYSPADAEDTGSVYVIDSQTGKTLWTSLSNGTRVSPNRSRFINFLSSRTTVIDNNLTPLNITVPENSRLAWASEDMLVFLRTTEGYKIGATYLDVSSNKIEEEVLLSTPLEINIARIEGIWNNVAIVQNTAGQILTLELPTPKN